MNDKARDVIGEVIAEDSVRIVPPSVAQHAVQSVAELQEVTVRRDTRIEEQAREIKRLKERISTRNINLANATSELAALKAQQPSGVVLPERKPVREGLPSYVVEPNKEWNAALDEVARLNACQVSAGGVDERAAFEAWRLAKFCGGEERLKKCSNAPDVYYYTAEQEAWKVWQARAALAGRAAVPDGWVMVPELMHLDASVIESINFHCGDGQEDAGFGQYHDGVLWVGEIEEEDGSKTYGLHIATADYPEEGSTTLVEFAAAPTAQQKEG